MASGIFDTDEHGSIFSMQAAPVMKLQSIVQTLMRKVTWANSRCIKYCDFLLLTTTATLSRLSLTEWSWYGNIVYHNAEIWLF